MPNHVHIIIVPSDEDGLRRTFADAHRRYTGYINARLRVTGHLWQGRFGSVVMDEDHLANAVRYISLNPVRVGLVERAQDWLWSSLALTVAEAAQPVDSISRPSEAICPSSIVVEEQSTGVTHTLEIDSLTHVKGGYVSVCSYEEQGLGGSADFYIYLSYNPDPSVTSHGCGRTVNYYAAPIGDVWFNGAYYYNFSHTTLNAWSTQRTVAVSWWYRGLDSAIKGAITVENNNEEVMLVETINRLVTAGFGAVCPSL